MNWQEFLRKYQANMDSPYEVTFVKDVLSHLSLDFTKVSVQTAFRDDEGRQRRIDFTIVEGPRVRLAIEVDGYNKDGVSPGMSPAQFVDWQRRERAMVRQGWRLLRFANSEVRREPGRCAKTIELMLELLRREAREFAEADEARRLRRVLSDLQQQLLATETRAEEAQREFEKAQGELTSSRSRLSTLQAELRSATASRDVNRVSVLESAVRDTEARMSGKQAELDEKARETDRLRVELEKVAARTISDDPRVGELEQLLAAQRAAVERFELDLGAAVEGRLQAEQAAELERRARSESDAAASQAAAILAGLGRENRALKLAVGGVVVVVLAAFAIVALVLTRSDDPEPAGAEPAIDATAAVSGGCADAIVWNQAAAHVGKSVTIIGTVNRATYRPDVTGQPTFFDIGNVFPNPRFQVVIWGRDRTKFPSPPEALYADKTICVTGLVEIQNGTPEIEADGPDDIELP